jgi:hypothetical protein
MILPILGISQSESKPKKDKSKPKLYKWEFGLNGGINLSNLRGDINGLETKNLPGTLYGVTIAYNFNKFFSLKADFDYESKGFIMKDVEYDLALNTDSLSSKIGDVKQVLNYFDIPAFMHIGFGKKLKFDINFGPYFAFKLPNNDIANSNEDGQNVVIIDNKFNDGFKKFDIGLTYGFGIDYFLNKRIALGFDFLIEDGLIPILKTNSGSDVFNRSLDFDFGINFFLGKKK